jgi:hypothetical protein
MRPMTFRPRAFAFVLLASFAFLASPVWADKKTSNPAPPSIAISSAALRSHVEKLASLDFRNHHHPEKLQAAADYVAAMLKTTGLPVERQPYRFGARTFENVVATLHPDKETIIVVGAHYDVHGMQPGADDNASGVAGLIELARAAALLKDNIPYQVQFVSYANEERPFFRTTGMGSVHHAESLAAEKDRVRLMLSLEMIGYFSDEEGSQKYPMWPVSWFRPEAGNFIALVSKFGHWGVLRAVKRGIRTYSNMHVEVLTAPESMRGVQWSDHRSYWKHGIKAAMVTDTAFFRNPNYHEPTDRPDTLDYERMAEVVKGLAGYLTLP